MCLYKGGSLTLQPDQCQFCGAEYEPRAFLKKHRLTKTILKLHICYECAFWYDQSQSSDGIIINGKHYTCTPLHDAFASNRTTNPVTCILMHSGELIATDFLCCTGVIPDRFLARMPDNAWFISVKNYRKLARNPFRCRLKGCWDRYNCARYDSSVEKDGPWNIVPSSHVAGSECCESFINKFELIW